jgi:hypothetical protein
MKYSSQYLDEIKQICDEEQLAAARKGFECLISSYCNHSKKTIYNNMLWNNPNVESSTGAFDPYSSQIHFMGSHVDEEMTFTPKKDLKHLIETYENGVMINTGDDIGTEMQSASKGDDSSRAKTIVNSYLSTVKSGNSRQPTEDISSKIVSERLDKDSRIMDLLDFRHDDSIAGTNSYDTEDSRVTSVLNAYYDFFQKMCEVQVNSLKRGTFEIQNPHSPDSQCAEMSFMGSFESNSGMSAINKSVNEDEYSF